MQEAPDALDVPRGRHRRFVAARRAASARLRDIVAEAVAQAEDWEIHHGKRKRRRKAEDAAKFALCVEALLADLACEVSAKGHNASLRLYLDRHYLAGREPEAVGEGTRQALEALSAPDLAWLTLQLGYPGRPGTPGKQSTFGPGPRLLSRLCHTGITSADTMLDYTSEELLRLVDPPPRAEDPDVRLQGRKRTYSDTEETERLREEMRRINTKLSALHVEVCSDEGEWKPMEPTLLVRRCTQSTFECGGRLWGAYGNPAWYSLPSDQRLGRLRIDGEEVASADIKSCVAALCYARAGVPLPEHDLYLPPGYFGKPARDAFKALFQACIFSDGRLRGWPRSLPVGTRPCEDFEVALTALESLNAPIAHLLRGPIIGHTLHRMESNVLVRALLTPGLRALSLHDNLLAPITQIEEAEEALENAFEVETGGRCLVEREFS